MKRKKELKFKKRRHISSEELFPKKRDLQFFRMNYLITQAFPNPVERKEYIEALIRGLEEHEE